MENLNDSKLFNFLAGLVAVVIALTQVACDDSSTISSGSFDEPLTLTGVRYQSPDSADAPEEVHPGDLLALEGQNMNAVARVYFNGVEASFNPALTSEDYLIATVPPDLPFGTLDPEEETFNTIRVENESSQSEIDFSVLPPAPQLGEMSNEYADPGEEVTIRGQYLYLIDAITLSDGTTISGDDVEAEADGSAVTFSIPPGTSLEEGPVSITTVGGSGNSAPAFSFHDRRGMICNFDDAQNWEWWNATFTSDASNYPGAEGNFAVMTSGASGIAGGDVAWYNDVRSVNLTQGMQWVDPDNLDEPPENFAVKFELAIDGTWNRGTLLLRAENEDGWTHSARYEPWRTEDGVEPVDYEGWRTVTVPLSEFRTWGNDQDGGGNQPSSLSELLPNGTAPYPGIMLINDTDIDMPANVSFAVDNIRVVRTAE